MQRYWKAIAAIVGTIGLWAADRYLGFDAAALGVADEIKLLVDGAVLTTLVYIFPANK